MLLLVSERTRRSNVRRRRESGSNSSGTSCSSNSNSNNNSSSSSSKRRGKRAERGFSPIHSSIFRYCMKEGGKEGGRDVRHRRRPWFVATGQ